jgi:hypothetical protein
MAKFFFILLYPYYMDYFRNFFFFKMRIFIKNYNW